jgi:HEAT repeats/Tetratricopeptide repeat
MMFAQRLGGIWLILLGLSGDTLAAYFIIMRNSFQGLLQHFIVVGVWAFGIHLLIARPLEDLPTASPSETQSWFFKPSLSGWTITAAILGWFTFPGIGTGSISFAYLISYLFRHRRIPRYALSDSLTSLKLPSTGEYSNKVESPSQVLPFIDILRQPNTEIRQAVVRTLGDKGDKESIKILRSLLADGSPDVRGDAAVVLTRLENDYNQNILKALAIVKADPRDIEMSLHLARLCSRFADSGLLDPISQQYYLHNALHILKYIVEIYPKRNDILIDLAQVHYSLSQSRDAMQLLKRVLQQQPNNDAAFTLLLEIAFAEQDWKTLFALTQESSRFTSEQQELLKWWTDITPVALKGEHYG